MGCNCCRMLNSYMFKPQEPQTNGYVNEGHSYDHDHSTSPTIKISELKNEGHGVIERDRFSGSPYMYNEPEKTSAKPDDIDSREPVSLSSNAILNLNFTGDTKHEDHPSRSDHDLQTRSPYHHDMDKNSNLTRNSDEPECIQHEPCEPMEENNSLTESAMLEVANSQLHLQTSNLFSTFSVVNGPGKKNWLLDNNTEPPDKINLGSSSSLADKVASGSSTEPSLVALMIERTVARNSKKGLIANGVYPDDDMDPDVAEALAALAAAIAGEELEDNYTV